MTARPGPALRVPWIHGWAIIIDAAPDAGQGGRCIVRGAKRFVGTRRDSMPLVRHSSHAG